MNKKYPTEKSVTKAQDEGLSKVENILVLC
jgi:hypothetical protein